jgi:hypothetical protein
MELRKLVFTKSRSTTRFVEVRSAFIDARKLAKRKRPVVSQCKSKIRARKILKTEDQLLSAQASGRRSEGRKDIGLACACHARKLDSTPARLKLSLVLYGILLIVN